MSSEGIGETNAMAHVLTVSLFFLSSDSTLRVLAWVLGHKHLNEKYYLTSHPSDEGDYAMDMAQDRT